jgi:hypothetical protein
MRVNATIAGSVEAILAAGADEISGALRHGIETASSGLLVELRAQIRSAGLGPRLEKAWQREVYPRGRKRTFHPAALVYSKSTVLHDAFDRGPTIVGQASRFLVIPTEAGRRLGLGEVPSARKGGRVPAGGKRRYADLEPFADRIGAEITSAAPRGRTHRTHRTRGPAGRQAPRRIVLVPATGGRLVALLHARAGARPVPIATLVPMVKLRKRLDIDGAAQRAETALTRTLSAGG